MCGVIAACILCISCMHDCSSDKLFHFMHFNSVLLRCISARQLHSLKVQQAWGKLRNKGCQGLSQLLRRHLQLLVHALTEHEARKKVLSCVYMCFWGGKAVEDLVPATNARSTSQASSQATTVWMCHPHTCSSSASCT